MHSHGAQEYEYDGAGRGLRAFFTKNGGHAAALIQYYERDREQAAAVGASILMAEPYFDRAISLFQPILGNPEIKYIITLEFIGLRRAEARPDAIPNTAEFIHPEFMKRRAYMSHEVSISLAVKHGLVAASSRL